MNYQKINDILNSLWYKHDFNTISLIFDVLRKTLRPRVFGVVEGVDFSGNVLKLKVKGGTVEKAEVRLHQEEIISRLNEALGKNRFTSLEVF